MAKKHKNSGLVFGYIAIAVLAITIIGMSISVWAKPYTSAHDTTTAIVKSVVDNTQTLVITDKAKDVFVESKRVDTLAINTAFLQEMRENGELLSSNEFASRITEYYNTLVAVLTALFVLFTIVTYITIKSKFEAKFEGKAREFEDKARNLEGKQRQKIVDELRSMLNDSKKIDEVVTSAVGGHIDDKIATKEEIDDITSDLETYGKNVVTLTATLDIVRKKQQELFKVVAEMQEQVYKGAVICDDAPNIKGEEVSTEETSNIPEAEVATMEGNIDTVSNRTE